MSKVVYLFGAGASIGTVPLVNEMAKRIHEQIRFISEGEFKLSDHWWALKTH
jgi:FlaA1/EpsC-like NDP-sugar epimerase